MVIVAGALENIDVERFRKAQVRNIFNEIVHPKWRSDEKAASIYYDVALLIVKEVNIKGLTYRKQHNQIVF